MSMNPTNWTEIIDFIAHRRNITRTPHGITANNVWVLSDITQEFGTAAETDPMTRDMGQAIKSMSDRYRNGYDRTTARLSGTPAYWVARDGVVIAFTTYGGQVWVRSEWESAKVTSRQSDALGRISDALATAAGIRFDD